MHRTVLELRAGSLPESDLTVRRVTGQEGFSEPYAFDVDFLTANGEPLDMSELRGASATITMRRTNGSERHVQGVIGVIEMTGVAAGRPLYRVRVVPRLALLAYVQRSRIFQSRSVPEIVKQVLDEAKVKFRTSFAGTYAKRDYCVQYRESDLEFVQRLLEEEGIFYWFEHGADEHVTVLADARDGCVELSGDPTVPFRIEAQVGDAAEDEHLFRLERAQRVRAGKVELKDYDFERPEMPVSGSSKAANDPLGLEHYEYPGGFLAPSAGSKMSKTRLEELRFGVETFEGEGTCLRFAPGSMFEVSDHPHSAFDKKLLLVRVKHEGRQQEAAGGVEGVEHGYRNRFVGLPADVPYRPRRRTRRPVAYTETAIVVGPSREEIHADAHGRVKVQFHWDRTGRGDDKSSCWIRVAQGWAGAAWGASFVPRVGQEVLVKFMEGDPDRPLIMGAVYNGEHPPPIALPSEKTRSTLRTDSSPGGEGSNELRFEDQKDAEEIYLHAQKDENIEVRSDKGQRIRANESLEVAKDRSIKVQGNQQLAVEADDVSGVGGSRTIAVAGNRDTATAGSHSEMVGVAQSVNVGGNRDLTVGAAAVETVGAAAALNIGGGYAINVAGAVNAAVAGLKSTEVGGEGIEIVGAHREEHVSKDRQSKTGGDERGQVDGSVLIQVDGDASETIDGAVKVNLADVLSGQFGKGTLEADELTIVVGGNVVLALEKSGKVQFFGKTITVDGSSIGLKGGTVKKVASEAARSQSVAVSELQGESDWVEFELLDDQNRPVAGAPYEVRLKDGSVRKGQLDANGHARIEGIKPDGSTVVFPER